MHAVSLPANPRSVAEARRLLRTALDGHQPAAVEDAILMISELVTNAVRHTRDVLLVLVTIHHDTLRVDVTDNNPTMPVAPDHEHNATSGRGLAIVEALADQWGSTPTADGKTIWFEISLGEPRPTVTRP
jgi:anti-sigma regulatory factor (Ser/Thr protein kinase)